MKNLNTQMNNTISDKCAYDAYICLVHREIIHTFGFTRLCSPVRK